MQTIDAYKEMLKSSLERFKSDVKNHKMEILRDDGLYRHVRFKGDGSFYYFDLITWPGVLTITGDCSTFVFSRTTDMFEFFSGNYGYGINPGYWSEKLRAPKPDSVMEFSVEKYKARVQDWLAYRLESLEEREAVDLTSRVKADLLGDTWEDPYDTNDAISRLYNFGIDEPYEWDLTEYSWHYLWCCWAIVWGIKQYQASKL